MLSRSGCFRATEGGRAHRMVIQLLGRRRGDRRRRLVENAFLMGLCRPCPRSIILKRTAHAGVGKLVPCSFNIHPPHVLDLTPNPRGDQASKRSEGMPAFGLPVLSFIFLVESFLFQIYWIKPCIFFREVRTKCLRRFILRCRGSHGSTSLHLLRVCAPVFSQKCKILKKY